MSGNSVLVDTNIVLYLLAGDKTLAGFLNGKQVYLSFISQLECLGFQGITSTEHKQIQKFVEECKVIDINSAIKNEVIQLKQNSKIKLPDAIIVSTAIYLGIPLLTADKELAKVISDNIIIYEP